MISTYSELFVSGPQSPLEQLRGHVELKHSCIVMPLASLWFFRGPYGIAGSLISLTTEVISDWTHGRNKIHLPKLTLEKTAQCGAGKDSQPSPCAAADGPLLTNSTCLLWCSVSSSNTSTKPGHSRCLLDLSYGSKLHLCQVTFFPSCIFFL